MDEKQKIAKEMGIDKPIMSLRHVGGRIELHLYGEDKPRVVPKKSEDILETELHYKKMAELKVMAHDLDISFTSSTRKADLIAAIMEATG